MVKKEFSKVKIQFLSTSQIFELIHKTSPAIKISIFQFSIITEYGLFLCGDFDICSHKDDKSGSSYQEILQSFKNISLSFSLLIVNHKFRVSLTHLRIDSLV
jgi:hypothetical protein